MDGCHVGRASWVVGCGTCVVLRALQVAGRASRVVRCGLWVVGRASNAKKLGDWQQFDMTCYCPLNLTYARVYGKNIERLVFQFVDLPYLCKNKACISLYSFFSSFALTIISSRERPILWDTIGGSLKISFNCSCCSIKCYGYSVLSLALMIGIVWRKARFVNFFLFSCLGLLFCFQI